MAKTPPAAEVPDVLVGDPEPALPNFEIAERRAKYGDLDTLREVDAAAQLVNQPVPMMTRWIYTGPGAEGRFNDIIARRGYQQVHRRELASTPQHNGWGEAPGGYVTRGEKGQELLVKMPKTLYEQIQMRKAVEGDAKRRSAGHMRQQVQEALGAEGQHRAADAMGHMQMPEFQESADVRKV